MYFLIWPIWAKNNPYEPIHKQAIYNMHSFFFILFYITAYYMHSNSRIVAFDFLFWLLNGWIIMEAYLTYWCIMRINLSVTFSFQHLLCHMLKYVLFLIIHVILQRGRSDYHGHNYIRQNCVCRSCSLGAISFDIFELHFFFLCISIRATKLPLILFCFFFFRTWNAFQLRQVKMAFCIANLGNEIICDSVKIVSRSQLRL